MSFTICNDNNEYINISYINNIFKLYYKEKLWKDLTNLYYDKMISLVKLFNLSNSKNLYNHINCNNKLEFNNPDIFNDIKIIIKKNLNDQLHDWEKNKNMINSTVGFVNGSIINGFSSITPEIKLEQVINYSKLDTEEVDTNNNFYDYLINSSGANNHKKYETNMNNTIKNVLSIDHDIYINKLKKEQEEKIKCLKDCYKNQEDKLKNTHEKLLKLENTVLKFNNQEKK